MRQILAMTMITAVGLLSVGLADDDTAKDELTTSSAKVSYAMGLEIGASLKEIPADVDLAIFIRGVKDGAEGKTPLLTPEQVAEIKKEYMAKIQADRADRAKTIAEKNRREEQVFLAENKKKDGVATTPSGLQYVVEVRGDGPTPTATDRVTVHYRGTLLDGTEFDSSHKRGQPAVFPVNGVIRGWAEALQLMNVGSKYRLFIPSQLAYGEKGTGQKVGPNALLIFEVELLGIEK